MKRAWRWSWTRLLLAAACGEGGDACGQCGPYDTCSEGSCSSPNQEGAACSLLEGAEACGSYLECVDRGRGIGEGVCVAEGTEGTACGTRFDCESPHACMLGTCRRDPEYLFGFDACRVTASMNVSDGSPPFSSCMASFHGSPNSEHFQVLLARDAEGSIDSPPPESLRLVFSASNGYRGIPLESSANLGYPGPERILALYTDASGAARPVTGQIGTTNASTFVDTAQLDTDIDFGTGPSPSGVFPSGLSVQMAEGAVEYLGSVSLTAQGASSSSGGAGSSNSGGGAGGGGNSSGGAGGGSGGSDPGGVCECTRVSGVDTYTSDESFWAACSEGRSIAGSYVSDNMDACNPISVCNFRLNADGTGTSGSPEHNWGEQPIHWWIVGTDFPQCEPAPVTNFDSADDAVRIYFQFDTPPASGEEPMENHYLLWYVQAGTTYLTGYSGLLRKR